jgi:hypothetical protein
MPGFSKSFWDRLLNKKIVVCSLSFAYPLLWQNQIRNNQIEIRTNTDILYLICHNTIERSSSLSSQQTTILGRIHKREYIFQTLWLKSEVKLLQTTNKFTVK